MDCLILGSGGFNNTHGSIPDTNLFPNKMKHYRFLVSKADVTADTTKKNGV